MAECSESLHVAARHGDLKRCKALLAAKADVNAEDDEGATLLRLAATEVHRESF